MLLCGLHSKLKWIFYSRHEFSSECWISFFKFSAKKHNKKWCSIYIFFPSNVKAHKLEASFWAYESSSWERIDQWGNLIWTSHWWWALLYTHDFFASSESSYCWSAANANYYIFKSRPKSVQKEHFHLMGRKYSL